MDDWEGADEEEESEDEDDFEGEDEELRRGGYGVLTIRTIACLAHELSAEAQASQSKGQSQRREESRCHQIQTQGFVLRLCPSRGVDLDLDISTRPISDPGGRLYGRADVLCDRDVDFGRA